MKPPLSFARFIAVWVILASALAPGLPAAQADNGQPPAAAATPPPPPADLPATPAGEPSLNALIPTGCVGAAGAVSNPAVMPIFDFTTITSTIHINTTYLSVWDVNVATNIAHTFNSDLDIHLISPAGTDILLSGNNGGGFDNVFSGTVWSDRAALFNTFGTPVTDYTFTDTVPVPYLNPQEPLGALRGQNPNGDWKLVVHDGALGDSGTLRGWTLQFSLLKHAPDVISTAVQTNPGGVTIPDVGPAAASLNFAGLPYPISAITVSTVITHPAPGTLTVTLTSPGGVALTLSSNNADSRNNVFAGTTWDDRADQLAPPGLVTTHNYVANVLASPLAPEEALSELLGQSANGNWNLKVQDDASDGSNATAKLGRVSLFIQTAHCFPDLQTSISVNPNYPLVGHPATLVFRSINNSVTATNVSLTANLNPQLHFQGVSAPSWACSTPAFNAAGGLVTCTRPSQGSGSVTPVAVTVTLPLLPVAVPVTETLGFAGTDTDPSNNTQTEVVYSYVYSQNQNPWDVDSDLGYVGDGGQDAFDDWGLLRLAVLNGSSVLTDQDLSGFGLVFHTPGQRWSSSSAPIVSGIQVSRQLSAPADQNWLRYVDTFHNTTAGPLSLLVAWGGNLGSDTSTYPSATSSGDRVIAANDDWAVTQQDPPPGPAGDAVVGYALRSPANGSYLGPVIFDDTFITTTWPVTGNDELAHLYTFSLAPGATKRLAYFVLRGLGEGFPGPDGCTYYGGCLTPATGTQVSLAANTVTALVAKPALCDLTPAERASLVNWTVPLANCHDDFLAILVR